MPPPDPSDDFSQLPTADGAVNEGPLPHDFSRQPPPRRKQTRIGPRATQEAAPPEPQETADPSPAQAPESQEAPSMSDEWQELFHSPEIAQSLASDWDQVPAGPESESPASAPSPPPLPQPKPRRTVVGRRAPAPESAPLPREEISPPEEEASTPSSEPPPAAKEPPPVPKAPPVPPQTPPASSPNKTADKQLTDTSKDPASPSTSSTPPSTDSTPPKDESGSQDTPATPPPVPSAPPGPWQEKWNRWGGKALSLSVAIHVLLLIGGATFVVTQVREDQVDFLPGGGTQQSAAASQALEHKIQQKKTPWLKKAMPARKIAAVGSISDIILPDDVPDLMDLPQAKDLLSDSRLTAGMGLGGAGGGFGKGMGMGGMSGIAFQPFSMFGMQIKAKKLALILDVSTSMLPHLPRVIEEVDKVAKGSVVILFFGCGLEPPPPGGVDGDDTYSTSSVDFEKFWRMGGASQAETRKFRIDPKKEIQNEAIFRMLSRRPQTYFIHLTGLGYTWQALLSDKVRTADGIYWFSDFQDRVDFKQINIVRENLQQRKQRLYMHAYMQGGSYDLVKTQLVEKTGGDVFLEE
ncbi:hypothetical protein WJU23_08125 [Prosthecobacter sp. SYSU 5D2]|uniref:hypothetical protein n=1 Tax=Prosthecobacter sp. SYSU 5D2 TaxID=3134134 RepID=UPI0031FE6CF5